MKLCKKISKLFIISVLAVSLAAATACSNRGTEGATDGYTENITPDASAGFLPSEPESTSPSENSSSISEAVINYIPELRDEEDAEAVITSKLNYTGKINLNGSAVNASGKNITVDKTTATITAGGTYYISGKADEGRILIDAADNKKVTLIFDNVEINNSTAPCIEVLNTKKLIIVMEDNSVNTINCTAVFDSETTDADAAFYSKEDLVLKGNGKLTVLSASNGITSNDSLEIYGGTYEITAGNNGLKGKDNVYTENCTITITAENDGIKSTAADDETLGYVAINTDSNITITSGGDGIQAETNAFIAGGTLSIVSGGGNANASKASQYQTFNPFWKNDGTTTTEDTVSCKGIKAGINITVDAGTITIDAADDAIHSNANITVNGGDFTLASGDDGMHSDTFLTINSGNIVITKSYEGVESADIIFNGGHTSIMASDDGINAAGGNDDSQAGGMWGGDRFHMMEGGNQSVTINGGYIYMNASGDGLDSNGNINMYGGTVIVNGPTNSGNGALDYGGTFAYNGGSLIVSGSSGMLQTPTSNASEANSICIVFTSTISANSIIRIEDSEGNEVLTYSSPKSYNALVAGSSLFEEGKTYKIYTNGTYTGGTETNGVYSGGTYSGTEYTTLTISGKVTSVGSGGGMMPGGDFGGGMRPGGNFGGGGMRPGGR